VCLGKNASGTRRDRVDEPGTEHRRVGERISDDGARAQRDHLARLLGDLYAAFGEHWQVENWSAMRAARGLGVSGEEAYTPNAPTIILRTAFPKWYVPVEKLHPAILQLCRQLKSHVSFA
jgi:hypothetical protein